MPLFTAKCDDSVRIVGKPEVTRHKLSCRQIANALIASAPKIGIEAENRQKFLTSEGHTPFPIREWARFPPESCKRRFLSCVLPRPKAYFFAGKLGNV